jgi:hypothetical protein
MSVPGWRDALRDEINHRYSEFKRLRIYAHADIPHNYRTITCCSHSCTPGNLQNRNFIYIAATISAFVESFLSWCV